MNRKTFAAVLIVLATLLLYAQQHRAPIGYDDTPMLPGGKWRVHDSKRPRPPAVAPGDAYGKPPADAIVLFDGKDLSKWHSAKGPAAWKVENGYMEVAAKTGDVMSNQEFGDCQLHVEWRTPDAVKGDSQERGNSGVFLMGLFEIQVLDSYDNVTYADGQAGAIYGQYPPLVNVSRKPGEWQAYDIVFTAPRFKDGKLDTPAYATVFLNGVVVQNHSAIMGLTRHRTLPDYPKPVSKGPLKLQDHNNPTRFRNIWVRELKERE